MRWGYLHRRVQLLTLVSCLTLLATGCDLDGFQSPAFMVARSPLGTGSFDEVTGFGANPGDLKMFRYIPADVPANAPLVVVLHACTQTALDCRNFGWEVVADEYKFYLVYPEQQTANNAMTCFNWAGEYGNTANLQRGQGENQSIIEMIDQMHDDYSIDAGRIYVTGQSAGGAQTALMLATWPDVFEAGAMLAGIPYRCTTELMEVYTCLNPGTNRSAEQWGDLVRGAYPDYAGRYPRVSLWHGTSDIVVSLTNLTELLEQWSNVHGIDTVADIDDEVEGYTHRSYQDDLGNTLVEAYELEGQGHGTFVDPAEGCGSVGNYVIDAGICSAFYIAEFFGIVDVGPPVGDPTDDVGSDMGGDDVADDPSTPDACDDLGTPDASIDPGIDPSTDAGSQTDVPPSEDGSCPPCNCDESVCDGGCSIVLDSTPDPVVCTCLFVCAAAFAGPRRKRRSAH